MGALDITIFLLTILDNKKSISDRCPHLPSSPSSRAPAGNLATWSPGCSGRRPRHRVRVISPVWPASLVRFSGPAGGPGVVPGTAATTVQPRRQRAQSCGLSPGVQHWKARACAPPIPPQGRPWPSRSPCCHLTYSAWARSTGDAAGPRRRPEGVSHPGRTLVLIIGWWLLAGELVATFGRRVRPGEPAGSAVTWHVDWVHLPRPGGVVAGRLVGLGAGLFARVMRISAACAADLEGTVCAAHGPEDDHAIASTSTTPRDRA